MSRPQFPPDIVRDLRDMVRRLDVLERAGGLNADEAPNARVAAGSPILGAAPSDASQFKVQAGTMVVGTNGSGDFTLTYPTPFLNGVVSVMVQQGDNTHPGATFVPYVAGAALGYQNVRVYQPGGAVWASSGLMRISWLAIGW